MDATCDSLLIGNHDAAAAPRAGTCVSHDGVLVTGDVSSDQKALRCDMHQHSKTNSRQRQEVS